jgi:hypothetical protein
MDASARVCSGDESHVVQLADRRKAEDGLAGKGAGGRSARGWWSTKAVYGPLNQSERLSPKILGF